MDYVSTYRVPTRVVVSEKSIALANGNSMIQDVEASIRTIKSFVAGQMKRKSTRLTRKKNKREAPNMAYKAFPMFVYTLQTNNETHC